MYRALKLVALAWFVVLHLCPVCSLRSRRARPEPAPPSAPGERLALPGPQFPTVSFDGGPSSFYIADKALQLQLGPGALSLSELDHRVQTAKHVWDCGLVLAKLLERTSGANWLRSKRVIELGSGVGAVAGLSAALLGAPTTLLTDMPAAAAGAAQSIALNQPRIEGRVAFAPLDWTRRNASALWTAVGDVAPEVASSASASPPAFDLILGADIVWVDELVPPLVETLRWLALAGQPEPQLCDDALPAAAADRAAIAVCPEDEPVLAGSGAATVLLAYKSRSSITDRLLFGELARAGFAVCAAPGGWYDPQFSAPSMEVFRMQLRPHAGAR
jgi:predicted nicotinamide N-methyase